MLLLAVLEIPLSKVLHIVVCIVVYQHQVRSQAVVHRPVPKHCVSVIHYTFVMCVYIFAREYSGNSPEKDKGM